MKEHAPKVSENTRVLYGASLKHLSGFLVIWFCLKLPPKRLTITNKRERNRAGVPPSINRSLSMLSKAFSLCVKEWEWVKENPVLKISREKENSGRDRWLTGEDEKGCWIILHTG